MHANERIEWKIPNYLQPSHSIILSFFPLTKDNKDKDPNLINLINCL